LDIAKLTGDKLFGAIFLAHRNDFFALKIYIYTLSVRGFFIFSNNLA
jgi:hypothetical protein